VAYRERGLRPSFPFLCTIWTLALSLRRDYAIDDHPDNCYCEAGKNIPSNHVLPSFLDHTSFALRGEADLMPRTEIRALWKKARTGPVWAIIQKAIDAGYPIEVDPAW
jgi:hypothetical protein